MAGNPSTVSLPSLSPLVQQIARHVQRAGGRAWVVGGSVRDALLGRPSKDVDLEVHGLAADRLQEVLGRIAPVASVGRSFGVFKVGPGRDPVDVALPRPASPAGPASRGQVRGDPHMGLEAACRGRDLTINAIAADALTGELADPTGGLADLKAKRLHPADPTRFGDDPLRVVRVARFAGVLAFEPSQTLVEVCRSLSLLGVAPERLTGELEKLLLQAPLPSTGLRVLHRIGAWSHVLPHLSWRDGIAEQVDRAAGLRTRVGPPPRDLALMWGALLASGSPEGAQAQLEALRVLRREGFDVRTAVVESLRCAAELGRHTSDTTLRTLAEQVEGALAIAIAEALQGTDLSALHARAAALGVLHSPLAPLLFGRDLQEMGVQRGPAMGRILREIRGAQLRGEVASPDAAMRLAETLWTLEQADRA